MALKKVPNPTYKQRVEIPVFGGKAEKVEITFRYFSEDDFQKLRDDHGDELLIDFLALLIEGWGEGVSEAFGAFSTASLKELANAYPAAPNALHMAFLSGRYQAKAGN